MVLMAQGALDDHITPREEVNTGAGNWRATPSPIAQNKVEGGPVTGVSLAGERFAQADNWADRQVSRQLMQYAQQGEEQDAEVASILVDGFTGADNKPQVGSTTPPPATEETPPPAKPQETPAATISGITANQMAGVSLGVTAPPKVPTMEENLTKTMEAQGKQVMFDMNDIPEWYDSDAFSSGLISFGLNLLSGNDLATSFGAAGKYFDEAYGREKREHWANDLVEQGYDAQDIHRWIQTGDNKDLTDPMDKAMKMQQYKMGQIQLNAAEYENSDEMRKYKRGRQEWEDNFKVAEFQQRINSDQARLALDNMKFKYEQEKDRAKGTAGKLDKIAPRDIMLAANQLAVDLDVANQRIPLAGSGVQAALTGMLGADFGGQVAAAGPEFVQRARQIQTAQNQFTDNAARLASGAVLKEKEQGDYRSFFFPQGDEWNDPKIVARKKAAQEVANSVAIAVANGQMAQMDPAAFRFVVENVSNGTGRIIRDQSGNMVGISTNRGNFSLYQ